jgi:hypothetical protein
MPGDPWDLDHKLALVNGGRHAEDNLAPALRDKQPPPLSARPGATANDWRRDEPRRSRTYALTRVG